jgi:hypothetical protein
MVERMESESHFFGKRVTAVGRYAINPWIRLGFYTIYGDLAKQFQSGRDLFSATGYLTFRF